MGARHDLAACPRRAWNVLEIAAEDTAPEMSAKHIERGGAYARLKPVGLAKVDPDCWERWRRHPVPRGPSSGGRREHPWSFATLPRVRPAVKAPEEWLEGKMSEEEPLPEDETPDGEGEEAEEDAPSPDETSIAQLAAAGTWVDRHDPRRGGHRALVLREDGSTARGDDVGGVRGCVDASLR